MKCSCGDKLEFLGSRLVVDSVEIQYFCLTCQETFKVIRGPKKVTTIYNQSGKKVTSWQIPRK